MAHKVEHIGIAVENLDEAVKKYELILGVECYKYEEVEREGVKTAFFRTGESKVELLQATRPDSAIAKFIEKKGEGLHHVAWEVMDIELEIERLKKEGFNILYDPAREGADNKLVTFVHPKETSGVLIELCQEIG